MASPSVARDPSEVLKHTLGRYFDKSHQSPVVHYLVFDCAQAKYMCNRDHAMSFNDSHCVRVISRHVYFGTFYV